MCRAVRTETCSLTTVPDSGREKKPVSNKKLISNNSSKVQVGLRCANCTREEAPAVRSAATPRWARTESARYPSPQGCSSAPLKRRPARPSGQPHPGRRALTWITALNQQVLPTFFRPTGARSCLFLSYGFRESLHTSVGVLFKQPLFSAMLASRTLKQWGESHGKNRKHSAALTRAGL